MSDPSITAELIGASSVVTVALIGAAVQLRALRKENTIQHAENKSAVERGFERVHERLDQSDRRFNRIEDRQERIENELVRRRRWRR